MQLQVTFFVSLIIATWHTQVKVFRCLNTESGSPTVVNVDDDVNAMTTVHTYPFPTSSETNKWLNTYPVLPDWIPFCNTETHQPQWHTKTNQPPPKRPFLSTKVDSNRHIHSRTINRGTKNALYICVFFFVFVHFGFGMRSTFVAAKPHMYALNTQALPLLTDSIYVWLPQFCLECLAVVALNFSTQLDAR